MNEVLQLVLLTLVPGLELRASIPYGIISLDMSWTLVVLICVVANALLGPIVFLLLKWFVVFVRKIDFLDRLYQKAIVRTQKKIRVYVDKYGVWGLAVFIGIPLPGSGSYTGALGAHILGLDFKKFIIANIIGVIVAAFAVTIVTLTGSGLFDLFVKVI